MNMRLTDWNASLAHAAELVDKLNQNGCNARAISYSMYDGRKGIAIQLFDRENNFSTEFKTGIFSTFGDMKNALNACHHRAMSAQFGRV